MAFSQVTVDDAFGNKLRVPEPSTLLLLGSGLTVLAGSAWRSHRRKQSQGIERVSRAAQPDRYRMVHGGHNFQSKVALALMISLGILSSFLPNAAAADNFCVCVAGMVSEENKRVTLKVNNEEVTVDTTEIVRATTAGSSERAGSFTTVASRLAKAIKDKGIAGVTVGALTHCNCINIRADSVEVAANTNPALTVKVNRGKCQELPNNLTWKTETPIKGQQTPPKFEFTDEETIVVKGKERTLKETVKITNLTAADTIKPDIFKMVNWCDENGNPKRTPHFAEANRHEVFEQKKPEIAAGGMETVIWEVKIPTGTTNPLDESFDLRRKYLVYMDFFGFGINYWIKPKFVQGSDQVYTFFPTNPPFNSIPIRLRLQLDTSELPSGWDVIEMQPEDGTVVDLAAGVNNMQAGFIVVRAPSPGTGRITIRGMDDDTGSIIMADITDIVFPSELICDVDRNGIVDLADISLIFAARGAPASPGDPRDVDGDGVITVEDARFCTLLCTNPNCAP